MVICLERGADDLHMVYMIPLLSHLFLDENSYWFNLPGQ